MSYGFADGIIVQKAMDHERLVRKSTERFLSRLLHDRPTESCAIASSFNELTPHFASCNFD
jgi:hypothetical protein